jgi:ABC-type transport system involved in cytochrome bd biosynthesis fused ATPase/permease subunit
MQRLTISIGAGDHVAIVGRSGAGESDCDLMSSDCDLMSSDCDLMSSDDH